MKYDGYLVLLLTLGFLSYIRWIDLYILPIFIVIGLFIIIKKIDVVYLIPLPIYIHMSSPALNGNVKTTIIYVTIITILGVVDLIRNRKLTMKGRLFWPLVFLSVASIITCINGPDLFISFAGFFQIVSILCFYLYFLNTLDKNTDNLQHISKILMYASVLVTFEMVYYMMQSDLTIIEIIRSRSIDLGWENINVVIFVNLMAIPLIAYLITISKFKLYYMLVAIITVVGILLTLSRSSILSVGVYALVLVPVIIIYDKDRMKLLIQVLLLVAVLVIGVYYLEQSAIISDYILTLFERDLLHYDDRLELLVEAWNQLKLHPIFGSGGIYSSRYYLSEFGSLNYHNTIAQVSTLGLVGIGGFIWLFVAKFKMIFQAKHLFKWYLFILIIVTAFINGMVQPMYFYVVYLMYLFLILAAYEKDKEEII